MVTQYHSRAMSFNLTWHNFISLMSHCFMSLPCYEEDALQFYPVEMPFNSNQGSSQFKLREVTARQHYFGLKEGKEENKEEIKGGRGQHAIPVMSRGLSTPRRPGLA